MSDTVEWNRVNIQGARYFNKADSRYPYVVVRVLDNALHYEKNCCGSLALAERKHAELRRYHGSNWKVVIMTAEQYNELVSCFKQGRKFNMQALPNPDRNLVNALVHVVWNQTEGKFVKAFATGEQALNHAQGESRRNPVNSYLLLTPTSRVFQPMNVQIESVVIPAVATTANEVDF